MQLNPDIILSLKDEGNVPLLKGTITALTPTAAQGTKQSWQEWFRDVLRVEDNANLIVSFAIFGFVLLLSLRYSDPLLIEEWYREIVLLVVPFVACYISCTLMGPTFAPKDWATLVVVGYLANAIGSIPLFHSNGVGGPIWAIVAGVLLQTADLKIGLKAEYFIKIGIVIGAVSIPDVISIGGRGLLVAWVDTCLLLLVCTGVAMCVGYDWATAVTVVGATVICGTSAATSIQSVVGGSSETLNLIFAILGVANTPLIPLMPLARNTIAVAPNVLGAWMGGSIDSTGQVIASATIADNPTVITVATIIKMTQNILIGPVCFVLSIIHEKQCNPRILIQKFPRFVLGFIITSLCVSYALTSEMATASRTNLAYIAEWFSLLGFVLIGTELKVTTIFRQTENILILVLYICVQSVDIWTTYGWSIYAFGQ